VLVTLFTNGTLVTDEDAAFLADLPPYGMEISVYGYTQGTYEAVTGVPGSHARCMAGIELLLKHDIPLRLKTMVLTVNRHELWDLQAFAERLGVDFYYDAMLNPCLDGNLAPYEYRLGLEELVRLDAQDPERAQEWKEAALRSMDSVPQGGNGTCGAGKRTFSIDPRGQLHPCVLTRYLSYDLAHGSFHEGWWEAMPALLGEAGGLPVAERCRTCSLLSVCQNCSAIAQLEFGEINRVSEFHCQATHLRAAALGVVGSETQYSIAGQSRGRVVPSFVLEV